MFETIDSTELATVDGGSFQTQLQHFGQAARHGAYEAYKTVVSYPTAAIAGYKLANQFYGAKATWHDRFRAMGDVRQMLAASDSLPAWASFGHG
jgi:hypothetical protein